MVLLRSADLRAPPRCSVPPTRCGDVTLASLVPTQLAAAPRRRPAAAPRLRAILLGGAGASRRAARARGAAGLPVAPTYGLTQACSQVTVAEPGRHRDLRIPAAGRRRRDRRRRRDPRAPDRSSPAAARCTPGDLGRLDERGRLIVTGRLSELIVSGGENVAPAEVEAVLEQHPAVAEAGVFGRPDPRVGRGRRRRRRAARRRRRWTPRSCARSAAPASRASRCPKAIEPVGVLPRTASGKLRRGALR